MTYDSLKFISQNYINLHTAIIGEFLDTATDEEYAKIPVYIMTEEEQKIIYNQGYVFTPSREYVPDESPLKHVYSMGAMPFKIKTKTYNQ